MSDRVTTVEDCILFFRAPEQPNDPATLRFVCGLGRQLADEVERMREDECGMFLCQPHFEEAEKVPYYERKCQLCERDTARDELAALKEENKALKIALDNAEWAAKEQAWSSVRRIPSLSQAKRS